MPRPRFFITERGRKVAAVLNRLGPKTRDWMSSDKRDPEVVKEVLMMACRLEEVEKQLEKVRGAVAKP